MLTRGRSLLARAAASVARFVRWRFPGRSTHKLQQRFAIPSYFASDASGDADWSKAINGTLLGIVVINPASGPGYTASYVNGTKHDEYQDRIDQMHAAGAAVLGYVTTNYRDIHTSVQSEHEFTVNAATNVASTDHETGWPTGFGPIQVRPGTASTLPQPLAANTDYFWISRSPLEGRFASSKPNAENGSAIPLTSTGGPEKHLMGLSRTLANISNVFFEIDEFYARWPAIDGMFFDEMNAAGGAQDLDYYGQIFDHVKAKGGKALVVQNPGTTPSSVMLGVADVFLTFEGPAFKYAKHSANLETSHPKAAFWHAVYACPVHAMPGVIAASRAKNASFVYVTERSPMIHDPWRHIASYFQLEATEVKDRNGPGAVIVH